MSAELIDGYVWLSSYDDRSSRNQEHSTQYKRLFDAIKEGEVHGLQDGKSKRWLVHKEQADEFLSQRAEASCKGGRRTATQSLRATPYVTLCSSQFDSACDCLNAAASALERIEKVLERLASAAESMAPQPKEEPVGTWRDMNGEAL